LNSVLLFKMVQPRKRKKKRDPARPKRAMTPFLYYACEQRNVLKEEGRKMSLIEQSRYIAGLWKNVTDKSKYEELSAKDRARYKSEMESYVPPYKLKRPRSSYAFFMRDVRQSVAEKYPEKSPRELMTDVAVAWRATDESVKKKYVEMAEVDKQRYKEELNKLSNE